MSATQAPIHRSWHVIAQAVRPVLPPSGRRTAVMLAAGASGVAFAAAMVAVGWSADHHSLAAYNHSVTAFATRSSPPTRPRAPDT